ncbi:glycosyltransferase family 4 protein [Dasania sp. GY-19]|uniref:Glycosyltransferase family 4 protein n=1 Tax=Dasania phycosphaerae TaxID=2950436 RepID=A0A9J6RIP5_9GAMM|nr:glycosyltransferase family 4 protein [Dasania phycosphaerae]MCZ0864558.1 glycosyltransferase family 4 protein [Dasania phycosphaerae]
MIKKKTVWYISKYANIERFGSDTRHASFCKEFSRNELDVRLITSNSSHLFETLPTFKGCYYEHKDKGVDVVWVNTIRYRKTNGVKRIVSWIWFELLVIIFPMVKKCKRPDVVIASSLSLFSVLSGSFFKFFYKSKFIFEIRDIWPQSLIDLKGLSVNSPIALLLGGIERFGYKYADVIVGTMPGLHLHVKEKIGDSSKVHFIPQGVSLDWYRDRQESVSLEYIDKYIPKNKFIVTYAGTFGVANALNYIVDAARMLSHESTNIHFLLVGAGSEEAKLKEQVLASNIKNITFAPRVGKNQVQSILEESDVLLASVRDEKVYRFGLSLNKFIDYMYAKKPIICLFSGYPSMINEAGCGEFIPSEDAEALVDKLLEYESYSKDDLSKLGQNGYDFLVNNRSFNVLAKQYMGLF